MLGRRNEKEDTEWLTRRHWRVNQPAWAWYSSSRMWPLRVPSKTRPEFVDSMHVMAWLSARWWEVLEGSQHAFLLSALFNIIMMFIVFIICEQCIVKQMRLIHPVYLWTCETAVLAASGALAAPPDRPPGLDAAAELEVVEDLRPGPRARQAWPGTVGDARHVTRRCQDAGEQSQHIQ